MFKNWHDKTAVVLKRQPKICVQISLGRARKLPLPDSVSIGSYAFARGYNFVKINIPDSVQTIGESAFYREEAVNHIDPEFTVEFYFNGGVICDNILDGQHYTHLILADYIHTIGNQSFANSSLLKFVSFPDTISKIGTDIFLLDEDLDLTVRYVDGIIDDYIYYNHFMITKVTIEDNIVSIGQHSFDSCKGIIEISVPDSINYIGAYAFYDCNSMASINIPDGVEKILSHTFYGCASLGNIVTPDSVTAVEDYAFYGCVAATSITLSQNCESIGEAAFYNCKALTELDIPASVKQIGECV